MMLWKNRNRKVGLCVMVVTAALVMATLWAVLATPETALAKKPVKPDDMIYYSVTMTGDLTIAGAFSFVDGECLVVDSPTADWGRTFNKGIRVNSPLPAVCIANAFLGVVILDGDDCSEITNECGCDDGVIPHGNGPNWGTLFVEGDDTGVIVNYSIGETDVDTGKCRRYTLTSDTVMPDAAEPNYYKVTVPPGTLWSLVQAKPGRLSATLTSTKGTVIEFIKTSP